MGQAVGNMLMMESATASNREEPHASIIHLLLSLDVFTGSSEPTDPSGLDPRHQDHKL